MRGLLLPVHLGLAIMIGVGLAEAAAGEAPQEASRAEAPPIAKGDRPSRKVVVGTAIFGPHGDYPGLQERLEILSGLIDEMARKASAQSPGRGLDLAILPETVVTASGGEARDRAIPLDGPVKETFGGLARKHRSYILATMDLAEPGPEATVYSNAAILFDRRGEVVGIYRKRHPVAYVGSDVLEGGVTPGRECPVFDCDFGKLGIQICWDVQYDEGWDALAKAGAEIVAWPTASPATLTPSAQAARHRYYVASSVWRNNATIYEPTGMVAARIEEPSRVLVHELDLSYAILGWSGFLRNGEALRERYGERIGFHYDPREDMGLFWSNDPTTTIGAMVRSIGGEELDVQVERNRRLQEPARLPSP
ncbi:carbon-nitrogen hydrolase family protein [Planctomyces sp. SH-PL62]|uniref:carbon-nitrogen hydrolase family protein n=1 Tax=Planctomyces sp. SH-PL62 TaxID=1636152 RepID=UPI00078EA92F|nr:carbon-nitrogen hydrolase family protein [Planctomyces sp. SH-PL62]AMV36827.1 N-carbamoyl-D-amino acid hydrolase [Planctomyces sp. SH-PL62]